MKHEEFVTAYREGTIDVQIDREAAAKLVSARMMLPLVLLPFLGLAVALAIVGYWIVGGLLFAGALAFRYAVRSSARGFVLTRSLRDPNFFGQAMGEGILKIAPISAAAPGRATT
jgi:hypothetical protein